MVLLWRGKFPCTENLAIKGEIQNEYDMLAKMKTQGTDLRDVAQEKCLPYNRDSCLDDANETNVPSAPVREFILQATGLHFHHENIVLP